MNWVMLVLSAQQEAQGAIRGCRVECSCIIFRGQVISQRIQEMNLTKGTNQLIRFSLDIPVEVYRRYYTGQAHSVVVRATDGRNIRLPAPNLRQFLTHTGIQGSFEMELDHNNKLVSIRRVS